MTYYHAAKITPDGYVIVYANYVEKQFVLDAIEKDGENIEDFIILTSKEDIE